MTAKYFKYAFALTGDKTAVPNPTQVDGSVSYQEGFPFDYQRPKTDAQAKNIPRDQTNQLFFDLSSALKQYQENAFPDWITNADNLGVDYPYRAGDYVRYTDGIVYRSIVNANTVVPGTDASKWVPFLFTSSNLLTGYMVTPSGIILQWGTGITVTGELDTVTFPLAFPTNVLNVIASESAAGGWGSPTPQPTVYGIVLVGPTTFNISCARVLTSGASSYQAGNQYDWFAIGH